MRSHLGTEWVKDDSGVSMFRKITLRKPCEVCGGTGRISETETHLTQRCVTRRPVARGRRGNPWWQANQDQLFGGLLALVVTAYVIGQFLLKSDADSIGIRIGMALGASLILFVMMRKSAGTIRFLRRISLLLLLVVMFGDLALEFTSF